jgi:hypothetical protein
LPPEGKQRFSFCLTASETKFRQAMRLPFSKGNEHWGGVRRRRGKAPFHPVGRNALLIRSVKSAFALLLTKVTKPRLTPDIPPEKERRTKSYATDNQRYGGERLG